MKNKRAAVVVLLATLLLGTSTAATAASLPTKAGNQRLAGMEASSLLALAPSMLPPGSTSITTPPVALAEFGPPMGLPTARSVVTRTEYWSVPVGAESTLAYFHQHPPQGLVRSGDSSFLDGTVTATGISWSAATSSAWDDAELEAGVTANGDGASFVRVESIVVWLDPTPYRDTAHGTRVHISVAAGCPRTVTAVGVHNAGNDLRSSLIPKTAPTAGLVCSYGAGKKLTKQHALNRSSAGKVASIARGLPLAHTDGAGYACPADFGTFQIVALRFPHRPDVDLWLDPTGCTAVANGLISTGAGTLAAATKG